MMQRPGDLGPKQKAWCDRFLPTIGRLAPPQPPVAHKDQPPIGQASGAQITVAQIGIALAAPGNERAADELHMSGWL